MRKDKRFKTKRNHADSKDGIASTVSHTGKSKVFLQNCSVKIKEKELILWLLINGGSFLCQNVADKPNLNVNNKEKLVLFTFRNKTPIEKNCNVLKITLEKKEDSDGSFGYR